MSYFVDFSKSLFHEKNRGLLIYLTLNLFLVFFILGGGTFNFQVIVTSFVIYIASLMVALSPIGEWILRWQAKCVNIKKNKDHDRLSRVFEEVYQKAKIIDPKISNNIKLFFSNDTFINALATGRNTICITQGATQLNDEELKAILAHEFGHLSNKDTDSLLLIVVGNLFVTMIFLFARFCAWIVGLAMANSQARSLAKVFYVLLDGMVLGCMWLWTQLGIVLVSHTSRKKEYLADKFAFACGYGEALKIFLSRYKDDDLKGIWKTFTSTHPQNNDRINAL